jgi:hypothetical protein
MEEVIIKLTKMYYVPPMYYWIDEGIYPNVYQQLADRLKENKTIYNNKITITNSVMIEKGQEYTEYKSNLIRLILLKYAHEKPNKRGKDLLEEIFNNWNENKNIREKVRKSTFDRTIMKITKYEKSINNIEEIMMLISLNILENY